MFHVPWFCDMSWGNYVGGGIVICRMRRNNKSKGCRVSLETCLPLHFTATWSQCPAGCWRDAMQLSRKSKTYGWPFKVRMMMEPGRGDAENTLNRVIRYRCGRWRSKRRKVVHHKMDGLEHEGFLEGVRKVEAVSRMRVRLGR